MRKVQRLAHFALPLLLWQRIPNISDIYFIIELTMNIIYDSKTNAADKESIEEWKGFMTDLLAHIEIGKSYVYFDGFAVATDSDGIEFCGMHSRHNLSVVPQVEALDDPTIIDELLCAKNYWLDTYVPEDADD